jgi:hypothetical protein
LQQQQEHRQQTDSKLGAAAAVGASYHSMHCAVLLLMLEANHVKRQTLQLAQLGQNAHTPTVQLVPAAAQCPLSTTAAALSRTFWQVVLLVQWQRHNHHQHQQHKQGHQQQHQRQCS